MTIEERQEAAKWFQNRAIHTTMPGAKMMFERAAEALSEGMQPQWIPCSERLPEDGRRVLFQMTNGYIDVLRFNATGITTHLVAWMPLPKPYGGESDEN